MKTKISERILIKSGSKNQSEPRTTILLLSMQSFSSFWRLVNNKQACNIVLIVNNLVSVVFKQKLVRQIKFPVPKLLHQSLTIPLDIALTFKSLFL